MVRILFLMLIFFSPFSNADNSLRLTVNTTNIEAGKAIHARLIAENINTKLSSINIHALQNNFGVEIIESANKIDNGVDIQELQINLYPRQTGAITIPTIHLGKHKTAPISIMVSAAKIANKVIEYKTHYNSNSVWQRQQIVITTTVITPSKFSLIKADDFIQAGIESFKLKTKKIKLNNGLYKLTAGWRVFPLISGNQTLTPPSISYRLNGKVQRKFFPPTQKIKIKELPSYIPPLMAVGKLNIESSILPNYLWRVRFSSSDISPTTLSSLSIPLDNIANIKFREPIINESPEGYFTHDIAIKLSSSDIITLPRLTFKTFNPITGKIDTYQTSEINVVYISTLLKTVLILLGTLIAYKLLFIIFNYTKTIILHRKKQTEIITSSLAANSPHELHAILNAYAELKKWGRNMSFKQLCLIWISKKNHSTEDLMNELSSACYAKGIQPSSQIELNKKVYDLLRS